ncbi:tol-pal system protein YbgF [Hahella ganghwensis]|uniref:tol-pal system protein YbgF n=1 Tax=Hahella ganghwensis TaxID=286420 RepID=UPI000374A5D4|nr:tol-pal system protein YbgF [Hahella ganghwensis]
MLVTKYRSVCRAAAVSSAVVALCLPVLVHSASNNQAAPVLQASQNASSGSDVSSELYFLVQQLQQEVRELRGKVEELQYQVEQSSKQERDRYVDLDRRILQLRKDLDARPAVQTSAAPASGVGASLSEDAGAASSVAVSPPSGSEATEYNAAYDLIKQRQYDKAVTALHEFISKHPDSGLAANAYYWLGEVYLVLPKLEQARQSFIIVVGKYPQHRKAPDALYKLGVTYDRLGNKDEARKYLLQTIERYPQSASANLAKDYLKQI